jgi:hypothetical protein
MPRTTSKTNSKSYTPPPPPMRIQPPLQSHQSSPIKPNTPIQIQQPSMLDTIKQGFSFGVGSSIAHNMVNSIFGPKNKDENVIKKEVNNEIKLSSNKIYEIYNKCLEKNDNNIDCNALLQNIIDK